MIGVLIVVDDALLRTMLAKALGNRPTSKSSVRAPAAPTFPRQAGYCGPTWCRWDLHMAVTTGRQATQTCTPSSRPPALSSWPDQHNPLRWRRRRGRSSRLLTQRR